MARRGKMACSILTSAVARSRRAAIYAAIYLALCLLAASLQGGEVRGGSASPSDLAQAGDDGGATEPQVLTPGGAVSDTVSDGETRVYALDLLAGQRALVEMVKGGLRVKVSVCAPERPCAQLPVRRYGRLDLSFSADTSARHTIEVRSAETNAAERGYEMRLVGVADAAPWHKSADEAARAAAEAESLRESEDEASKLAALKKYGEAERMWRDAGDFSRAAQALCDMGDLYFALSQYGEASAHYSKALALGERGGDQLARLAALGGGGYVDISLGENQRALSTAQEMLDSVERAEPGQRESADYRRVKAQALNIKGEVHYAFGELRKSIEMFDLALLHWTEVAERSGQALAFLNLGHSYSDLGEPQAASEHFGRSLALWQSVGEGRGTALAQTALGGAYSTLGEEQLALNLHRQAAERFRVMGDRQSAAIALNGVGSVYQDSNEHQAAFDNYSEALRLYEEIGNRGFTALNKFLVGRALYHKGETERAFANYRESLDLSREVGDRVVEAHALKGLAAAYFSRGDTAGALAQFGAALDIYFEAGNRRSQAYALNDIGHVYAASGDVPKALASYAAALPLMRETRDRRGEALTLFNTAKAELKNGNLTAALSLAEASIAIGEYLRTNIRNSRLRTSYFTTVHEHYELYIDLLMRLHAQQPDKGFAAAALVASERARARSLLDSLFEDKIKPRKGLVTELLHRQQELLRSLDERAEYQARLSSRKPAAEEAEQVAQEIRALTIEYQDVRSRLREQSPRVATLTQPGQLRAEDIQGAVKEDDTLLLEFALGDEKSYLWAVSADGIAGYELPDRATIEGLSRRTYELLTARQSAGRPSPADEERLRASDAEYWRQSAALSTMLLGPVAGRLGSKRLLIVSDGFLKYIPFEALLAPGRHPDAAGGAGLEPLFFNHEIVYLPSALTLTALRYEKRPSVAATKTVAVIADPVFEKDDPRVSAPPPDGAPAQGEEGGDTQLATALRDFGGDGGQPVISRLPSTLREAKAITEVLPAGEGLVASGFAATKEQVVNGGLRDYRIIHFATHGLLNSASPELSGVVLSLVNERGERREGFLRLHNIYDLELSADLVVISACRTALGRNVRGEGVVGLASGFMYAGARSVVASLWKVDDDATAELMGHFYAAMLRDGLPPAAALKRAKREMWEQERWRAPFYWAAFTLQGAYTQDLGVSRRPTLTRTLSIGAALVLAVAVLYSIAARRWRWARVR